MAGRIKRRMAAAQAEAGTSAPAHAGHGAAPGAAAWPLCPLCQRAIPPDQQDAHHLVPRAQGGRQTALLHRICHRQIHALLTEVELARHYPSIEALSAHPELARFVAWVQRKPEGFFQRTRKSARLRR